MPRYLKPSDLVVMLNDGSINVWISRSSKTNPGAGIVITDSRWSPEQLRDALQAMANLAGELAVEQARREGAIAKRKAAKN